MGSDDVPDGKAAPFSELESRDHNQPQAVRECPKSAKKQSSPCRPMKAVRDPLPTSSPSAMICTVPSRRSGCLEENVACPISTSAS